MTIQILDAIIYWLIVALPFAIAVAPAPENVFMGLIIFCFLVKKILAKKKILVRSPVVLPFIFLLLISLISMVHSVSLADSLKGGILRLLQYAFIAIVMIEEIKDVRHMRRIFWCVVLACCFITADGIWQVSTGKDFVRRYDAIYNVGLVRATASFKDSNLLGIYLSAFAPLLIAAAFYYYKGIKKNILLFLTAIPVIGIVITYSRPTLLALYASLLILGLVKKDKRLLTILITAALLFPLVIPQSVKVWAKEMEYNPLRLMCNDDRIAVYRNSFNMIRHHPMIGVGVNTYMQNYRFYKEKPEYRNIVTLDYMYAHNNFIHMAGEIGLVGLGAFLWFLYALFSAIAALYRKMNDPYLKNLSLACAVCLAAFLINGLTESSLYYSRVAILFWYLIGLALALEKFSRGQASGEPQ